VWSLGLCDNSFDLMVVSSSSILMYMNSTYISIESAKAGNAESGSGRMSHNCNDSDRLMSPCLEASKRTRGLHFCSRSNRSKRCVELDKVA
jgi:hypothetical protein